MSERATPARDALFDFLREFIRAYGFAPTVKQMCAHTGRKPSTVRHMLWRLWREGLSDGRIAERLGCSGAGVQRARKRMGWETKWAA